MMGKKKAEIFQVKFRKPPTKQFLEITYIYIFFCHIWVFQFVVCFAHFIMCFLSVLIITFITLF